MDIFREFSRNPLCALGNPVPFTDAMFMNFNQPCPKRAVGLKDIQEGRAEIFDWVFI